VLCGTAWLASSTRAVAAHSGCWARLGPTRQNLTREQTALERWHAVHALLDCGVGLLDCFRRLGLSLNTVKRYAGYLNRGGFVAHRNTVHAWLTIVGDHLRTRRTAELGVSVKQLLDEIIAVGCTGGLNLLYKYINQAASTETGSPLHPAG
jgi:hypothetical protein